MSIGFGQFGWNSVKTVLSGTSLPCFSQFSELAEFQCDCDVQHSQCFNVPGLAHLDIQCLGSWRSAIGRLLVYHCINHMTTYYRLNT